MCTYIKCVVSTTVLFWVYFSNRSQVALLAYASIPLVGSSKKTTSGSPIKAIAQLQGNDAKSYNSIRTGDMSHDIINWRATMKAEANEAIPKNGISFRSASLVFLNRISFSCYDISLHYHCIHSNLTGTHSSIVKHGEGENPTSC